MQLPHSPKALISHSNPFRKHGPGYLFKKHKSFNVQDEEEIHQSKDSLNSSNARINTFEASYEEEYRKMGQSDKYCEEFMCILDD